MSTFTENIRQTFHVVSCYTCGVPFGITSELYRRVVTDAKGSVFCPSCGNQTCWRESDDQKKIKDLERRLKWESEAAERQRNLRAEAEQQAEHLRRSRDGMKGVVAKIKKRVGRGVCPCCNRHFANLQRHMENQHPEVAIGEVAEG